MNINNETTFSEGYVTLPLSAYNALLAQIASANNLVSVKKGWSGNIEVDFSTATIYSMAIDKLNGYCKLKGASADSYNVTPVDSFYINAVTIATTKPEEEDK